MEENNKTNETERDTESSEWNVVEEGKMYKDKTVDKTKWSWGKSLFQVLYRYDTYKRWNFRSLFLYSLECLDLELLQTEEQQGMSIQT